MGKDKEKITTLVNQIEAIKQNLCQKIEVLPDNPKITRLNHNCFEIHFSDLGESWSPFYHDFKAQYRMIIEILETKDIGEIIPTLQKLTTPRHDKSYWFFYKGDHNRFHPDVIRHIKTIL